MEREISPYKIKSFIFSPYLEKKLFISWGKSLGFPGGSDSEASACNVGDPGSIPGLGRSLGEGNGNPVTSPLAGKIPWTEETGRLKSMGSQRVRHDWKTSLLRKTLMFEWLIIFLLPSANFFPYKIHLLAQNIKTFTPEIPIPHPFKGK